MSDSSPFQPGGLPDQTVLATGRAVFTESYAVIPKGTMTDIVTSGLPHWAGMRAWILARPLSGFAETFSYYLMELAPGGGSDQPDAEPGVQSVIYVSDGVLTLFLDDVEHKLIPGSYIYLGPDAQWRLRNRGERKALFHWVRKRYDKVLGIEAPSSLVTHEAVTPPIEMPDTQGCWATTRFVDPSDMRHDMHVNIVTFAPGGSIPFAETHVMEHGIFVLEGRGVYRLNQDWIEVEAGDFIWLRAFCPQACYAGGPENFKYLLYKDVNRHAAL